MRTKSRRALVARMMLGVLLFAQAAIAGAACSMPERSPAQALAATQSMPCHQSAPEERNANLCLADCLSFDQNSDTPQLPALAPDPAPVLFVAVAQVAQRHSTLRGHWLAATTASPLRILFQSFQI